MTPEGLRRLGMRQYGVASRRQARDHGLDANAVDHRIAKAELEAVTRRVLRFPGSSASDLQRVMIEVLDAGLGAVASHRTAAALWGLPGFHFELVEITRPRPRALRRAGHVEHRPRLLLPHHVTEVQGIPCTSLPRTLFDLAAAGLPYGRLFNLVSTVVAKSPAMAATLRTTLEELAAKGRPGIAVMRSILAEHPPGTMPVTGLERKFETILRRAGERPLVRQVDLGGHSWIGRVDYLDPEVLLIVEVDSQRHHTSPADRARDAARDAALLDAGYREVLRIPEEWIWWEPWRVAPAVMEARARCRQQAA